MHHRRPQRLFRGIVVRGHRRVVEEDEQMPPLLPEAHPQPARFDPGHRSREQVVAGRVDFPDRCGIGRSPEAPAVSLMGPVDRPPEQGLALPGPGGLLPIDDVLPVPKLMG
jgi:hypothetical protein